MKIHRAYAERNRGPILEVLQRELPREGRVLELASGSGQHVTWFAAALPGLTFQPSDPSPEARASVDSYVAELGLANVAPAIDLDVHTATSSPWDAMVCINMIHIAPPSASVALFDLAARSLPIGGPLVTYGPYRFHGAFLTDSNAEFDASLRSRNPEWGVRDVDWLDELAAERGLSRTATHALPANNHALVFRRVR